MFENLTNSDALILGALIGIIIVIGVICIILTIKGGKKGVPKDTDKKVSSGSTEPDIHIALATENIPILSSKEEVISHNEMANPINDEILESDDAASLDEPAIVGTNDSNEEIIFSSTIPSSETETTDEVLSLNRQVEAEQDNKNSASIEEVLKAMQGDLEKQKYEKIDRYEEEQEENAVISYQELLNRKMALSEDEELNNTYEEEKVSKSYLDELPDFKDIVLEPIPDRNEERPFMNSEFVSPIFGRLSSNVEYPTVKKTTVTEELVKTEIISDGDLELSDENDDFLNTLKEFRRNL
jgi:hypothetical protein